MSKSSHSPSRAHRLLNQSVGKALHRYNMISDGDRIGVGVSGGRDSLTLMEILNERRVRVPIRYELIALYLDPGFGGGFASALDSYCREKGYSFRIEYTDHGIVGHSRENRENPCFLCSRLRRKRLFELSDELGCCKLALGHCKDDIIETLLLNMCYAGEISTMVPAQELFGGGLTVIRPLAFVDKELIHRYAVEKGFPSFENPCPTAKVSKRKAINTLLNSLYSSNKKIKGNLFRAMSRVKPDYLLKP